MKYFLLLFAGGIALFAASCRNEPSVQSYWAAHFPTLGSGSSPQCTDLNADGVLDIVIGASQNEYEQSDSAVLALDGKTGKLLWRVAARDQMVGSATFADVTGDGIKDVFIGGRSAEFMAINGATGAVLWHYEPTGASGIAALIRYNFFNTQLIPDQDGDGLNDLLFSNGGNARAANNSSANRYPGVLGVFSSRTGKLLAADTVPDGKETYMSPVIADLDGKRAALTIIFGTGGETLGGHLYRTDLTSLMQNHLASAIQLAAADGRGFIAPATLADINDDGCKDIIANWFGGKLMAFDGSRNKLIWERWVPHTESYTSATPGFFNDDAIPDFFITCNKGAWPDNRGSIQMMVDGRDGSVLHSDSLGCMGYSSAVSVDSNDDGFDEVIWSVNDFNCNPPLYMGNPDLTTDRHALRLFDLRHKTTTYFTPQQPAKNVSSTPWLGDLDGDGKMEVVYCVQRNTPKVDHYNGIQIETMKTSITARPTWGGYMGNGSGVFDFIRH